MLVRLLSSVPVACGISMMLGVAVLSGACGDLKTATPATDGDGDGGTSSGSSGKTGSSGSSNTDPGSTRKDETPAEGFGPGSEGALPSGYCCNDDSECRSRHCEDLGGGKMCRDRCFGDSICTRPPDFIWTCDNSTENEPGFCAPPGAFTCIPAAEFERGTRAAGDCCTATHDGVAGLECAGGRCSAINDNPYICTQACSAPKDCPSGFICQPLFDDLRECIPANRPYTCN